VGTVTLGFGLRGVPVGGDENYICLIDVVVIAGDTYANHVGDVNHILMSEEGTINWKLYYNKYMKYAMIIEFKCYHRLPSLIQ
jgi:hypothetical protein